jgi:hypothetical protein
MTRKSTMFHIDELHPNLECEACDDYDHCLPRWEDDGGGTARLPLLARAFEQGTGRDHQHLDKPPVGARRFDPVRGRDGGRRGGARRMVRPSRLTSCDIEAEVLVSLARKGYEWSGTLRGQLKSP